MHLLSPAQRRQAETVSSTGFDGALLTDEPGKKNRIIVGTR
jgi:hypothetical protein